MKPDMAKAVFTPHEVGLAGYNSAKAAAENEKFGIDLDIAGTDIKDYFAPLMPWEIVAVQAQTSNGKSYFFDWWEAQICRQLARDGRKEIILHVSFEETIEAMAFYQYSKILDIPTSDLARGKVDLSKLEWGMSVIDSIPVYRLGDSAQTADDAPELYLSNVYRSIKELIDGGVTGEPVKPAVIFLDYLQAFPIDPEVKGAVQDQQRRLQVRNDVYRSRKMATHLHCPVVIGVQAKQRLDGSNPPYQIPGMYDGEETASIAQRFDRIMSLWMPKTSYTVGDAKDFGTVTENGIWLKINKQRGGLPAGKSWELKWEYAKHDLISAYGRPQA